MGTTLQAGLVPDPVHTPSQTSESRPHFLLPITLSGPTMKLKRLTVLDKYKDIIDSFYREQRK